jgi:predicted CXXCH cytochrome family protein
MALRSFLALAWAAALAGCKKSPPPPAVELPEPPVLIAEAAADSQPCFECHVENAELLKSDAHAAEGFSCVVCHGLSTKHVELEEEGSLPDRSWRRWKDDHWEWRMDKATLEIARYCASCHGRPAPQGSKMKTIDWSAYINSKHGLGVREGKPEAPACTDCHAAHGLSGKPWTDDEINEQCASCHADAALMQRAGLDPNVVAAFKADEHANMADLPPDQKSSCVKCHHPHARAS